MSTYEENDKKNFKMLDLKKSYRSLGSENILTSFLLPILKFAKDYKRSVGFFTLSALVELYDGIEYLMRDNNGSIQVITSPKLIEEDYELIRKAYEARYEVIDKSLIRELNIDDTDLNKYKASMILEMIVDGIIDIKLVTTNTCGMYHDKLGIVKDSDDNTIVFYGSSNETRHALIENYEKIRVDYSWIPTDVGNIADEIEEFDQIWTNRNSYLQSFTFSEAVRNKMIEFIQHQKATNPHYIKKAIKIEPRPYQLEAIEAWVKNGYKGLFSMATGTGKTITSIFAVKELLENKPDKYLLVVIVPYVLLIDQWRDNLKILTDYTIGASSDKKHVDWLKKLQGRINSLNSNLVDLAVLVTTIDTYKTSKMQNALNRLNKEIIFLADEVHNYGTYQRYKVLPQNVNYRLGLSATPKRHFDDEGSLNIENYFDGIVYEFPLEKAIGEFLVPYEYHPVIVYLTEQEQVQYDKKTDRIMKLLNISREEEIERMSIDSQIVTILNQRAKIIAVAENKVPSFFEEYDKIKGIHNLVYCGAALLKENDESEEDESEIYSQINKIQEEFNKRRIYACKYVSNETDEQKEFALNQFKEGKNSVLIAIKCLDEGVDIPVIERAFILASTTNHKEFIQRRGRVLRKCNEINKQKAYIYDFITFPHETAKYTKGLLKRELGRLIEFSQFSLNKNEHEEFIEELKQKTGV